MRSVSAAKKLLFPRRGSRLSLRAGRMAGANGNPVPRGRVGSDPASVGHRGGGHGAVSAVEAQEGHQTLRREDK